MEAHELKAAANAATAAKVDAELEVLAAERREILLEQKILAADRALRDAKQHEAEASQALLDPPDAQRSTAAGRAARMQYRAALKAVETAQAATDALAEHAKFATFATHSARERSAAAWAAEQNALAALEAHMQAPATGA